MSNFSTTTTFGGTPNDITIVVVVMVVVVVVCVCGGGGRGSPLRQIPYW